MNKSNSPFTYLVELGLQPLMFVAHTNKECACGGKFTIYHTTAGRYLVCTNKGDLNSVGVPQTIPGCGSLSKIQSMSIIE